jgi:hypothetical protein
MKRKLRKLTLTKETLHGLAANRLEAAVGGLTALMSCSCAVGCTDLCTDTCRPCRP